MFHITELKRMLWVLKRHASMMRFFLAHKKIGGYTQNSWLSEAIYFNYEVSIISRLGAAGLILISVFI